VQERFCTALLLPVAMLSSRLVVALKLRVATSPLPAVCCRMCWSASPQTRSAFPWFESYRRLHRCAPSPAPAKLRFAQAGEGWGGGKPHTPSPEASAFAQASRMR